MTNTSAVDSVSGGRGMRLLRAVATNIDYERTHEQRNRLTVAIGSD